MFFLQHYNLPVKCIYPPHPGDLGFCPFLDSGPVVVLLIFSYIVCGGSVFDLCCFMFVCLLGLMLYVPVNSFSVMSGWVFLSGTGTKQ